ncbi:MAG TPA: hypothetical protein VFA90_13180 [Terriglobales bacterium]|nr:hypothetical protein [Terriglobales bacterium]
MIQPRNVNPRLLRSRSRYFTVSSASIAGFSAQFVGRGTSTLSWERNKMDTQAESGTNCDGTTTTHTKAQVVSAMARSFFIYLLTFWLFLLKCAFALVTLVPAPWLKFLYNSRKIAAQTVTETWRKR